MPRSIRIIAALTALLASCAPAASASQVIAPPGNSGVSQYVEVVPSAGGGTTVGSQGHKHGVVLSPSTQRKLAASGSAGKALAAFAQSTGVPRGGANGSSATKTTAFGRSQANGKSKTGRSGTPPIVVPRPTAAVGSGSGGLGLGLPIALTAITLAALGAALIRRRVSR